MPKESKKFFFLLTGNKITSTPRPNAMVAQFDNIVELKELSSANLFSYSYAYLRKNTTPKIRPSHLIATWATELTQEATNRTRRHCAALLDKAKMVRATTILTSRCYPE